MNSREVLALLGTYESPNVTFMEKDGSWPIVWERARGVYVWDADGRKYVDLTAAFGVGAAGHANARVVKAGRKQMKRLLHAMGDVHPHRLKAELAQELSRITFERWGQSRGRTIFCNSGFEAIEAALKTAVLATGRNRLVAFEGGYHGLGYGTLNATHREMFRKPFSGQVAKFGEFVPFPTSERELEGTRAAIERTLAARDVGAVLVEPVQGRGGIRIPPRGFVPLLRKLCYDYDVLLVLDEVYTGFGRTGRWFACEHSEVVPDVICLGKAIAGGFPISACVGKSPIMEKAWPVSQGEAIHTSTFLGHPVGCAMALAQIDEIRSLNLVAQAGEQGQLLLQLLSQMRHPELQLDARGIGLMAGIEISHPDGAPATDTTTRIIKAMLKRGYIMLPEGAHGNVLSFTPPLIISQRQLRAAVKTLEGVMQQVR